jgi:hypothetical protein
MRPIETTPGMGGKGDKGVYGRGEFNYSRTFVPQCTPNTTIKK